MASYRIYLCVVFTTVHLLAGQVMSRADGKISQNPFGQMPDGRKVTLYELTNENGLYASIIDYGAILVSLRIPDRNGKMADMGVKGVLKKLAGTGHTIYQLPPEELKRWEQSSASAADEWVAAMEAKGLPGKMVLKEAQRLKTDFSK